MCRARDLFRQRWTKMPSFKRHHFVQKNPNSSRTCMRRLLPCCFFLLSVFVVGLGKGQNGCDELQCGEIPTSNRDIGVNNMISVITHELAELSTKSLTEIRDRARGGGTAPLPAWVLVMLEDDLPYQVRITPSRDLETVGSYDFDSLGYWCYF
jgi:hypothetical protein